MAQQTTIEAGTVNGNSDHLVNRKAVEIRTKVLAPDDPEMVSSLNGLCQVLNDEGHEADADVFERQALAIYRRAPGKYRNDFATTLFDIGAFAVVVGAAITQPESITARFVAGIQN